MDILDVFDDLILELDKVCKSYNPNWTNMDIKLNDYIRDYQTDEYE